MQVDTSESGYIELPILILQNHLEWKQENINGLQFQSW